MNSPKSNNKLIINSIFKISAYFSFFSLLLLSAAEKNIIWVDTFDRNEAGKMPRGWKGRTEKANQFYIVKNHENDPKRKYLSVKNFKTDEFIIKAKKVDIVKYPYLNWKWRVHTLPPLGNESVKSKCDVPASMNVVLYLSRFRPKSIKYTWSTTLDKGTVTDSPYAIWPSRCDIVVLESGSRMRGKWKREKRNVLADYKEFYKIENPISVIIEAILIMSDSDNTGSVAEADYDNIYFSKN
jgi:hypothetical protein